MTNIEVICIDAGSRPNEVPTSRWIEEGKKYHIVEIAKMVTQGGIYGCKLDEIDNDDLAPYQYFRLSRFAISLGIFDDEEMLEAIDIGELKEVLVPEEKEV